MIENVLDFFNAGLSIVPLKCDGSKGPLFPWKCRQRKPANELLLRGLFEIQTKAVGAGIVCGVVSGGLEILDFDNEAERIFPAWSESIESILCRLPVVETPRGGFHVYYRCKTICAGRQIALDESGKVLIESRGEGNMVTACISPAEVHSTNYPYVQVAGPVLPEIPRITPEERKTLWAAASAFDRSGIREKAVKRIAERNRRRNATASYATDSNIIERARRYVAKMEPAIEGQRGHATIFNVACKLILGFNLAESDAFNLLEEYNERCVPPFSAPELEHKISQASDQPGERGFLIRQNGGRCYEG